MIEHLFSNTSYKKWVKEPTINDTETNDTKNNH
jgi:hypothetical protein